jgi:hypothetical protein
MGLVYGGLISESKRDYAVGRGKPPVVRADASPEESAALLWQNLASFALRAFRELNPRTLFATNWHIELIAAQLAAVRAGRIRRLLVNLPPRHLKSHLASVAFPAWCLGHQPSAQILCVTLRLKRRWSIASVARGPGPRRQTLARLPPHRRLRLVPGALSDPPLAAASDGS